MVAEAMADTRDPWWIIGSAAVALHGMDVTPRDVDLLTSKDDARRILASLSLRPVYRGPDSLFRSAVLGVWAKPPLPVEIMAELDVAEPTRWRRVHPVSRESVSLSGHTLYVPSALELTAMLLSFGRPKDLERARLLTR